MPLWDLPLQWPGPALLWHGDSSVYASLHHILPGSTHTHPSSTGHQFPWGSHTPCSGAASWDQPGLGPLLVPITFLMKKIKMKIKIKSKNKTKQKTQHGAATSTLPIFPSAQSVPSEHASHCWRTRGNHHVHHVDKQGFPPQAKSRHCSKPLSHSGSEDNSGNCWTSFHFSLK